MKSRHHQVHSGKIDYVQQALPWITTLSPLGFVQRSEATRKRSLKTVVKRQKGQTCLVWPRVEQIPGRPIQPMEEVQDPLTPWEL